MIASTIQLVLLYLVLSFTTMKSKNKNASSLEYKCEIYCSRSLYSIFLSLNKVCNNVKIHE